MGQYYHRILSNKTENTETISKNSPAMQKIQKQYAGEKKKKKRIPCNDDLFVLT